MSEKFGRVDSKEVLSRAVVERVATQADSLRRNYGRSVLAFNLVSGEIVGFGFNVVKVQATAKRKGYNPSSLVIGTVDELAQRGRYYLSQEGRA